MAFIFEAAFSAGSKTIPSDEVALKFALTKFKIALEHKFASNLLGLSFGFFAGQD